MRAIYLNVHGITSPLPVPYKDEWVMRLNAPNTYSSFVLSGVKGDRAQPTIRPVRKKEPCWFKPVKTRNKQLKLFKIVSIIFRFFLFPLTDVNSYAISMSKSFK